MICTCIRHPMFCLRKMDDVEMAQRIITSGMKGYAIKSHYFCTSERAETIRKIFPGCNAVGTITLNSSVGGINPMAVEMAGRSGAKTSLVPYRRFRTRAGTSCP